MRLKKIENRSVTMDRSTKNIYDVIKEKKDPIKNPLGYKVWVNLPLHIQIEEALKIILK